VPVRLEASNQGRGLLAMVGQFLTLGIGAFLLYGWAYWYCYLR
jgi:hypothetical protein